MDLPVNVVTIAVQIPVVGIVVWFMLRINKDWRQYLTERNGKLEKALHEVADALKDTNANSMKTSKILALHDLAVRTKLGDGGEAMNNFMESVANDGK